MRFKHNAAKDSVVHRLTALALCLFLTITSAHAEMTEPDSQPLDALYEMVLKYLKQKSDQKIYNPQFNIQEFGDRLRLPRCETPPEIEDRAPAKYYGRMTIRLICPQPEWKIYVTANVEGDLPVIVTTKGILKEAVIGEEDVEKRFIPYQKHRRGALLNIDEAIGMRAKKGIGPHTILTVRMLEPPYWVFKNNRVTLVTYVGNLKVESFGTALEDGVKNQQIAVKNASSEKIVKGIVIAPNVVAIP